MNTVVIYYSFSGKTKAEAEKRAREYGAKLIAVKEKKHRGKIGTFLIGCPQAMKRSAVPIAPLGVDLAQFEKIVICAPVWAGHPAPAFNSVCALLPKGREIEVLLTSGGGSSPKSKDGTRELIRAKGCTVTRYDEIKTAN